MSASIMRVKSTPVAVGIEQSSIVRPRVAGPVIGLALFAGVAAGWVIGSHAPGNTGDVELTHLLRAMAVLKLAFVTAAASAIMWRLQAPVTRLRLTGYALVSLAMAAGPALIWCLAYLGPASILLHGGVAAAVLLLWRDEAMSELLEGAISRRRSLIRSRHT